MAATIPVYLITGFLGSGKTTFLNHFIRSVAPQRVLVVENEVGAVNIDGALVATGAEDVVELTAGCLCCSLLGDLHLVLERVSARRNEFDLLVIETTGVADPSSIAQLFVTDLRVQEVFELHQVICLVDAIRIEAWLAEAEEALRQVAMADILLLNKANVCTTTDAERAAELLRRVNPTAEVLRGSWGVFPVDRILGPSNLAGLRMSQRLEALSSMAPLVQADAQGGSGHGITSFSLSFDRPLALTNAFSVQVYRLLDVYRHQVYRIKGILDVVGYPNRVVLQSVRTSCVLTDGTSWEDGERRTSCLVFIGRGLRKATFENMFAPFLRSPQPQATA